MTASRLSRRSLFGLGLGRLLEERLGALDLSGAGSEAPGEPDTDRPARRKDAARKAWGEGDPSALSAWVEPAAAHLLEVCGVARGQRLLDVAAGDGNLALAAVQAGAEVTAADFSPVLVERGRERTRASGADVEWNVADVEALPYADESFDCVASNFGVIYADDSRRAVAELERVVRPGGTVALTAWASSGLMARVLRLAVEREGAASPGAKPERWGRYETAFLHFSRFDDFEMLDATLRMEFDSREEMWSLVSSPPGPLAGALRAGADAGELREEFLGLVAGQCCESTAGVALEVAYSVVLGRRQVAASLAPQATIHQTEEA
jgi:SAM-dependent methyltransferase